MPTDEHQLGVIAQDVDEVYPEAVITLSSGVKSVNYNGLVGPLIEAFKAEQRQIEAQELRIEIDEKRLETQQYQIDQLRQSLSAPSGIVDSSASKEYPKSRR